MLTGRLALFELAKGDLGPYKNLPSHITFFASEVEGTLNFEAPTGVA